MTDLASLSQDAHRPRYHFLPPANWLNDPNGLIHWKGEYHLFYQYNPYNPWHELIHWGHAVSPDLVHWTHLPVALAPTPDSPDQDGCFSGCAVDHDGVPTIIFTGVRDGDQLPCLATGDINLRSLHKYPGNPLIASPPPDLDLVAFRDHSIWKEDDGWYQLIGSGLRNTGGTALLYRSPDLINWEYLHPLYIGDLDPTTHIFTGSMWECPDFFPLGDKHVLSVSVLDGDRLHFAIYFVGTYAGHKFTPIDLHKLDCGRSFYAPQSFTDQNGRRIMFGWLREMRDDAAQVAAGWSGVMSLPRVLSLRFDGMLDIRPAPELETLRGRHYRLSDLYLTQEHTPLSSDAHGDTLEISAEFEPGDAIEVGLTVRCSPDRAEQTRIYYNCAQERLYLDSTNSSLDPSTHGSQHSSPLSLASGETLHLRVFLDLSAIEVFGNDRVCLTDRIYPTRRDSLVVELLARDGIANLKSLDVWQMVAI